MTTFKPFIHVERLGKEEVEGILNGTCYITPKMDGTNANVWLDNEGNVCAGSRTRQLSVTKDNAGFYEFIHSEAEEARKLSEFVIKYPHIIVYGEWKCGKVGAIKDYNPHAKDIMFVFDMYDAKEERYLNYDEIRSLCHFHGLGDYLVPLLACVNSPTIEQLQEIADNNKYMLEEANHAGEGIVIRNYDFRNKYGHYEVAKLVREEYIQNKKKPKQTMQPGEVEASIAEIYVTDAELSKAVAKTIAFFEADTFNKKQGKMIGFYLNTIMRDAVLAEITDIVKKFKNPTIDFRALQGLVYQKARDYINL